MQKTDFAFEIILGEDESTDGTREICIEYAEKHTDKIKLFLRSRKDVIYINGLPTGRYNFIESLKAAKGKYIALCEGDDYWTDPYKLQRQVDFLEANPDYSICFHAVEKRFEEPEKPSVYNGASCKIRSNIYDLAYDNYITTCSVIYRNKFGKELPFWFNKIPVGDWGLHLIAAGFGDIYYIPNIMAVYRVHKGGIWGSQSNIQEYKRTIEIYDKFIEAFADNELLVKQFIKGKKDTLKIVRNYKPWIGRKIWRKLLSISIKKLTKLRDNW